MVLDGLRAWCVMIDYFLCFFHGPSVNSQVTTGIFTDDHFKSDSVYIPLCGEYWSDPFI